MEPESLYHIYNRGNNSRIIFYEKRNYSYFLEKVKRHFIPHLGILAYCLMPNHFHFLVYTRKGMKKVDFSNDLKVMLRSYTRAINKQEGFTGSLFQQHTKTKPLEDVSHPMTLSHRMTDSNYPLTCFHYIHQNPMKARLVSKMEDWKMSSFREYAGMSEQSICSRSLAYELLDISSDPKVFLAESYKRQIIEEI